MRVLLLPSGIDPGGCFPRARPQPRRPPVWGLRTRAFAANVVGGSSKRNGFRWNEQCAVPLFEKRAFGKERMTIVKLYVSVDMEGITGLPDYTYVDASEHNYERARKIMTDETNYVIHAANQFG